MSLPDLVGLLGVGSILFAYAAAQSGRLAVSDWRFSAVNAAGAGLILVSLWFDFNLPAFVIESAWLAISLWGLWRSLRTRVGPIKAGRNKAGRNRGGT